eukprot:1283149-Amphidinium_carterae.1
MLYIPRWEVKLFDYPTPALETDMKGRLPAPQESTEDDEHQFWTQSASTLSLQIQHSISIRFQRRTRITLCV